MFFQASYARSAGVSPRNIAVYLTSPNMGIYLMVVKCVVQLSVASVPAHLAMKGFLLVQSIQAQKKMNVLM
jgi:hypothetical protein